MQPLNTRLFRHVHGAADRWTRSGAVTTAGVTMPCGAELSACDPHQIVSKDVLQKDISETATIRISSS
jgi:hypothetical protein